MLLRKITKHVTDQNWFALFIDFIIVVAGVFIGIQVANWNEERKISQQRNLVQQRLVNDFNLLEEFSIESMDKHKQIIISLDTLIKAIEQGEVLPEEDEAIKFALRWAASYLKKMLRSPTYVELISSGQLNLITDKKIRSALAVFDQRALDTTFNFRSIHNVANVNYNYFPKYSTLQPVNPGNPSIREVESYDFAAILSDENYLSHLKIILDLQSWYYSNIKSHNRELKKVIQTLEGSK